MERSYQIDAQALEGIKADLQRQIRLLSLLLPLAALLIGVLLGWLGLFSWLVIGLSFALLLPVQLFLLHNYLRIQEESWQSLRFVVSPGWIRREEAGRKAVELRREEVDKVIDLDGGPLVIYYQQERRTLAIPREIEGFHLIRAQVLAWMREDPPAP